jgi:hypothetical protein
LIETALSGATASEILTEIETIPSGDPARWKLLIALGTARDFTADHASQVDRLLLAGLQKLDRSRMDFANPETMLAASHCLRLQGLLTLRTALLDAIKKHAPRAAGEPWHHPAPALIAAMALDAAQSSPQVVELAELAAGTGSDATLRGAAWRLLAADTRHPGFAREAGAWLRGGQADVTALFSTANPSHETTLNEFLRGDLGTVINRSLAGYAIVGLLRTNTTTSIDSVVAFLTGARGTDPRHAEGALAHVVGDVQPYLDPESLPGLLRLQGIGSPAIQALSNRAVSRVVEAMNGVGMTPRRRSHVRKELLRLLQADDVPHAAAIQAVNILGIVGTIEDVEQLERFARNHQVEPGAAVGAIVARAPEIFTLR